MPVGLHKKLPLKKEDVKIIGSSICDETNTNESHLSMAFWEAQRPLPVLRVREQIHTNIEDSP